MSVSDDTMSLEAQTRRALAGPADAEVISYQDHWYSWADLRAVADEVSRLLDEAGVPERGVVGFVPRNRPSAIAAELGLVASRRTIRMIYAFQSTTGITRDVERLKLCAVVAAAEDFTPELVAVAKAQGLVAIGLREMSAAAVPGAERCSAKPDPAAPAEPQIQVHTSGTTGPPKNVGFSYGTIAKHMVGENVSSVSGENDTTPPVLLTFPLGNISGIYTVFPPMLQGRRAVLMDRFTLDGWRDYIRRYQPAAPMLPPAAIRMALDADIPKEELACMKVLMTGAAPLDPTVQHAFEARYGVPILLSYGATEFGGPVTAMTPDLLAQYGGSKLGSVGRPFAGARLRVIDMDTGEELPLGTEGLLEVSAPRIGPHWIRTTDMGMIDEDGFVFHRGRSDGAIVRGGFKLLPEAIERALCLHPAVAAAAVVGIADRRLGQAPAAAVQIKPGAPRPSEAELALHLRDHVYSTHIPVVWTYVETIPRNNSFKTDLPAVRALFERKAETVGS